MSRWTSANNMNNMAALSSLSFTRVTLNLSRDPAWVESVTVRTSAFMERFLLDKKSENKKEDFTKLEMLESNEIQLAVEERQYVIKNRV